MNLSYLFFLHQPFMSFTNTLPKLPDQVYDYIRTKRYSLRTETQYAQWIKHFMLFHDKRHPQEMWCGRSRDISNVFGSGG